MAELWRGHKGAVGRESDQLRVSYRRHYRAALLIAALWIAAWVTAGSFVGATKLAAYYTIIVACMAPALIVVFVMQSPRGFNCEHCHKFVRRSVEWVCAQCDERNFHVGGLASFFKCRGRTKSGCGGLASGYRCHYCGEVNWFESAEADRNPRYVAARYEPPVRSATPEEENARKLAEFESRKHLADKEVETVQAENRLKAVAQPPVKPVKPKPKSIRDEVREEFDQALERFSSSDEAYVEASERLKVKFKDYPELLEKHLDYLKEVRDKII